MPVFTEESTASRDLRVLPRYAPPLPDLNTTERTNDTSFGDGEDRVEKYDVVVVGVCVYVFIYTLGHEQGHL